MPVVRTEPRKTLNPRSRGSIVALLAFDSRLINISNRGFCGIGDQVMIPGFVISSERSKTLLVRVVGPTLGGAPSRG